MKKVAVIFGGMSSEHDVSILSGMSVLKNLDKKTYSIYPIYIDKKGEWYTYKINEDEMQNLKIGNSLSNLEIIENPIKYLKQMDCVFPVLHGLYGEDGTIQGLLELINIPYVGCKVLSSSIAMDKTYTKMIFERAGLNQAKYIYIRCRENKLFYVKGNFEEIEITEKDIIKIAEKELKYPMFVKPANSGSSVGVSKANNCDELLKGIKIAQKNDCKILIEQGINGKEVECAVLEYNGKLYVSGVGEVKSPENFYSFDSKYKSDDILTQIPADIDEKIVGQIQEQAKRAFRAIDGNGLSRVDFFVENDTNKIIINEINTMPGFTNISMYPQLFEKAGIGYSELLDKLVQK